MNSYLFSLFAIFLISFVFYFFLKKKKFFLNYKKDAHQKFASDETIPLFGGYIVIISFVVFDFTYDFFIKIIFVLMFLLGILSDVKKLHSPPLRLFIQILLIFIFLFFSNLQLISTRIDLLDYLLSNYYFNILFTSFCILILINGSNFIDGLNGLLLGYYIIVTIILLSSSINLDVYFIEDFLNKFIFILIILLILNLSNKLYLGDSGSYTLGFIFSTFLINLYLVNNLISPYFVILLLWYPCFENLFSILRKFRFKKSPTYPDNKHLHQLIFEHLLKSYRACFLVPKQ